MGWGGVRCGGAGWVVRCGAGWVGWGRCRDRARLGWVGWDGVGESG